MAQAAAKGFNFLFVGGLLPFGEFQGLQHILHIAECTAEGLDDLVDVFDGL